jgi:hypothetical protein
MPWLEACFTMVGPCDGDGDGVGVGVTLLLHCCYTVVTLLLHCC